MNLLNYLKTEFMNYLCRMKFTRTILFVFILTLHISCGSNENKTVLSSYPNGKEKVIEIKEKSGETVQKKIYESGKTETEGTVNENGRREGIWKYYYPTGNLWSECNYVDGKRDGKTKVYYKSGSLRYEGSYINDSPAKEWTFYNEKNEVVKTFSY